VETESRVGRRHAGWQSEYSEQQGPESVPEPASWDVAERVHRARSAIAAAVPRIRLLPTAEYSGRKGLVQLAPDEHPEALRVRSHAHRLLYLLEKPAGAQLPEPAGFVPRARHRAFRPHARVCARAHVRVAVRPGQAAAQLDSWCGAPHRGRLA